MSHAAVAGHEHLCQVVRDEASLVAALRNFLTTLDGRNGLFVHRYSEADAWRLLDKAGLDKSLRASGRVVVVSREAAFQGGSPRINHDHVAETVGATLAAATEQGRGLSIIADASHAYISEGRASEWFAFESWLAPRLAHNVALVCLYWERDLDNPAHLDGMMKTHLGVWGAPRLSQAA